MGGGRVWFLGRNSLVGRGDFFGRLAGARLSVVAKVRAVRTGASGSLASVRNGGEGWGEEALRNCDTVRMDGAPLSPALSPFVPHGARETDALLVTAVLARTFATTDIPKRFSPAAVHAPRRRRRGGAPVA